MQATPSQTVSVLLASQPTTLNVYQKSTGLFMDVLLNNALVIGGVICENLNVIIRDAYFGYVGDFAWIDTQGATDPAYTGIGTRYFLGYFSPAELPAGLP
jgi:hypothetical protein